MEEKYYIDISEYHKTAQVEIWYGVKPIIFTRRVERSCSKQPKHYLAVEHYPKDTLKERIISAKEVLQPVCDWLNNADTREKEREMYEEECSKIIKEEQ